MMINRLKQEAKIKKTTVSNLVRLALEKQILEFHDGLGVKNLLTHAKKNAKASGIKNLAKNHDDFLYNS